MADSSRTVGLVQRVFNHKTGKNEFHYSIAEPYLKSASKITVRQSPQMTAITRRLYSQREDVKQKRAMKAASPEYKMKRKAYTQRDAVKARRRETSKRYRHRLQRSNKIVSKVESKHEEVKDVDPDEFIKAIETGKLVIPEFDDQSYVDEQDDYSESQEGEQTEKQEETKI